MRRGQRIGVALSAVLVLAGCSSSKAAQPARPRSQPATTTTTQAAAPIPPVLSNGTGPAPQYDCNLNPVIDAYDGAGGSASAIGWEGNQQGVVTCLGGTFLVQDGQNRNYGFGIYDGSPTRWADADGYLPAQVTSFSHCGAAVSITEFADRVVFGGHPFVAVYSRVRVANPTTHPITADPEPSPGMVELDTAADVAPPHAVVDHDYVVAADRFGDSYPWPSASALASAGGFDAHFAHMSAFWNQQLAQGASVQVPDTALDDAYKSGFIYTEIARSGDDLDTGVNGYASEFSHDVIGILGTLLDEGHFTDARSLLLEARKVLGQLGQYVDATWTYSWPWAVYLEKTGDVALVKQNFATQGPAGRAEPSIEDTAHAIAADRTGPGGIMGLTDDIDSHGYWTVDDEEALTGLAAYRYLAQRIGDTTEARWATSQYDSLLAAMNATLTATISRFHLDYLPCSLVEPNTANRCNNPQDANWAAPFLFGRWNWDAQLFGADVTGPAATLVDPTYAYGFSRLVGVLPADTFGGYPSDYYSTGYNAGYGIAGLASNRYRSQGIDSYEFMIDHDQSGPYSWWESSAAPASSPWLGDHPAAGQGSSPHAWGIAMANEALLDSLLAQRSDGSLIVGRGIPAQWLRSGDRIEVTNFPTTDSRRIAVVISVSGSRVSLRLEGRPSGPVLFQLPSFVEGIARTSAGRIDERTGTVTIAPTTNSVTVTLR